MNRERVKELLPVMQAFAEGKEVEWRDGDRYKEWQRATKNPAFEEPSNQWRVKQKPRELWAIFDNNDVVVSLRDTEMEGYTLMREVIE